MWFFKKQKKLSEEDEALSEIEQYIESIDISSATNEDADLFCNNANKLLRKNYTAHAIKLYKKIIQINPQNYIALSNLGSAYIEEDKYEMAIKVLDDSISINPKYTSAWYNLGNAYFYYGLKEKAKDAYAQVLILDPGHFQANNNIKLCH